MLPLIAAIGLLAPRKVPLPVFEMGLEGQILLRSGEIAPRLRPGTQAIRLVTGTAFRFDGQTSGIILGDPPALRLTKSLTIACWVKLDAFSTNGVGSQLVFRGDDRNGLDPYSLSVSPNGLADFLIQNRHNEYQSISSPIQLTVWTHLMASLDDRTGEMLLWINGQRAARAITKMRPLGPLDPSAAPGVSIGNVQFDRGPHNQPLHGEIADVRIYNVALTPKQIGLDLSGWITPLL